MGTEGKSAYLVMRHADGFGDVYPLSAGRSITLGRARTCDIVLRDDLCSRQHAEVYFAMGAWYVRDLGSLNGTRVNGDLLDSEWVLTAGDELGLGRTRLLFVEDLSQLPACDTHGGGMVQITRRLGQTRYDLGHAVGDVQSVEERHRLSKDLALLYRLALDMASAGDMPTLAQVVLSGLLEGTLADAAALLRRDPAGWQPQAFLARHQVDYLPPPEAVLHEVSNTREAVLAHHPARQEHLRQLHRQQSKEPYSVVCAPIPTIQEEPHALLYLFCQAPLRTLDAEDLELTVAVAKQYSVAAAALQKRLELAEENQRLKAQIVSEVHLVGTSPAMREVTEQITRVAGTNSTVLIRGESGTGKELVARAIHLSSARRHGPFVCLNCAALAESLLESELFGHEKGAFTGASERKMGKFEAAHGGTLFLDEIGEMPLSAQAKLLRILEGHPYERVGGTEPVQVNVRVVAATNKSLEEAIKHGSFRKDLYFRLHVVEILLPPLRDRRDDIPLLAEYFLQQFVRETGRKIRGLTPRALDRLLAYSWPGNVRELRNVIERAVVLANGPLLDAEDILLSRLEEPPAVPTTDGRSFRPSTLETLEKEHIVKTLDFTDWNKSRAAALLGIERSTLDRKIRAYGLRRPLDKTKE
ncbi:MAG: sigma-54-dependent Fis family transcriptional regulator [Gemmataceae bacterium]